MDVNCDYCGEKLERGARAPHFATGNFHMECGFRMIIGSVGHQRKLCSCYGGTFDDPPDTTRRQAAIAAQLEWQQQQVLTCAQRQNYLAMLTARSRMTDQEWRELTEPFTDPFIRAKKFP